MYGNAGSNPLINSCASSMASDNAGTSNPQNRQLLRLYPSGVIPPGINPLPALWRSVKHEDIYLQDYGDGLAAGRGLDRWFTDYNGSRPHQALDYATPAEYYFSPDEHGGLPASWAWT